MVFRLSAPAVEVLVQRSAVAVAAGLDAGDDAADPAPAVGGVEEFLEAAHFAIARRRLDRRRLETCRGAFLQAADMALQRTGRGEAKDVVNAIRLAPVEDLRTGVVAVGAQQDVHLRPVGADRADQAPEKGADLDALRPLRRAQDGGDEAALAIEDDDRLEAVVVIMGVEQALLLATVYRVE